MATSDLIRNVMSSPGFVERLRQVTVESVARQFPALRVDGSLFADVTHQHDWAHLLTCASLLAQSADGVAQDAALRIAHHSFSLTQEERFLSAAVIALDMLSNQPAIRLAKDRGLIRDDYFDSMPLPLRLDWVQRAVRYTIVLGNNTIVHANRFQRYFWDEAETSDWLSVSAPTSAGKSFLLVNWLGEYLRDRKNPIVVYVVPTRALIQQVQFDLETHFKKHRFKPIKVSCLPLAGQISSVGPTVFVLTQERLHILLHNLANDVALDLLVVDEAQKVSDGARGVLLQMVVEAVATHSPAAKFVFASPTTDNPDVLLKDAPGSKRTKGFRSEQVTVNQNLLWVSPISLHPKTWKVELCLKDEKVSLGNIELSARPGVSPAQRLAHVSYEMGRSDDKDSGGNLVYVNGAADAEKIARILYGLAGEAANISTLKPIADLSALIKKVIHPQYALASVINRGIAFHYGNMPLLIRNEIETLFKHNIIHFLVCTSTLVEGVNLPAKSIFVRGPNKGKGNPMSDADFWNLAGRAGRMGKEFQGNVVCVDPQEWANLPPTERRPHKIEPATDAVLQDGSTFIQYLNGDMSVVDYKTAPKYEHVLGYLFDHVLRYGSIRASKIAGRYPTPLVDSLDAVLVPAKERLRTPHSIVKRNPGISPMAMDVLLKYFEEYPKDIAELFPKVPEEKDAKGALIGVFDRINRCLAPISMPFGSINSRVVSLGILVVEWMRGYPLARLISQQIKLHQKDPIAKTIRKTMEDVERVARFLAPKYVSCYTDILRYFLESSGKHDLAYNLPDLTLWMEFGASKQTHLSLMSLGLSRSSAILVAEFIPGDEMTEADCIRWLEETDLATLELPNLVIHELERLKESQKPPGTSPA